MSKVLPIPKSSNTISFGRLSVAVVWVQVFSTSSLQEWTPMGLDIADRCPGCVNVLTDSSQTGRVGIHHANHQGAKGSGTRVLHGRRMGAKPYTGRTWVCQVLGAIWLPDVILMTKLDHVVVVWGRRVCERQSPRAMYQTDEAGDE